ncbi:hypothetical protein IG631_18918 [Alternaria alternata]|nr:hypothetical protein IG631_18918 [Alternaria alternata]
MDPTVFPNLRTYSYYLWITQIVTPRHHCRCVSEVVHLRLAARAEFLHAVPSHYLAFDLDGYCLQLPCTSSDIVRMYTPGAKLELWIHWRKPLLGERHTRAILLSGYQQHHHRCSLHGCTSHLSFARPVEQANSMGYSHCLLTQYSVSENVDKLYDLG